MNPKLAFFCIFAIGAIGTIANSNGAIWPLLFILPAVFFGLAAATFLGWFQWPTFERFITVPLVLIARFFNHEIGHDQYLAEWAERNGGKNG